MTYEERISKLKNGSDMEIWAAKEIERLRNGMEQLIEVAERCDSCESFPSKALDEAYHVLNVKLCGFDKKTNMKKTIYLYRLTDANGDQSITIVDDPSDVGCIGGYDRDGKYQQYDSYELYHAYEWAEKHGMKLENGTIEIDVPDSLFVKMA